MLVTIKDKQYFETKDEMLACSGSTFDHMDLVFCADYGVVYQLFKGSTSEIDRLVDGTGAFIQSLLYKFQDLVKFSEVVEEGYTNITSLNFLKVLNGKKFDYHYIRRNMKEFVDSYGFTNLLPDDKEIAIKFCTVDTTTAITYFMSGGLSLTDSVTKLKVLRSIDISNAAKALSTRASDPAILYIAVKHMSEENASLFGDSIRNFLADLRETAHLGMNYGQTRDGIMDYIEATNAYTNSGLSTFEFETGFTYEQCKNEFINFLIYGIKPEEFDVFSS